MKAEALLLIFALILLVGTVVLLYERYRKPKFSQKDRLIFQERWKKIKAEKNQTLSILEADKLLDHVLKKMGYGGSLGEKLKKNPALFSDLNGLWYAHKLRNQLAHELNRTLTTKESETALRSFQRALRDLKALP